MAAITVRNLPDETLRALKLRAAKEGRSTEAEIREILAKAVRSPVGIGSALAHIGRKLGGVDLDVTRRSSAIKPADFE
jgi:plasmid stability protein